MKKSRFIKVLVAVMSMAILLVGCGSVKEWGEQVEAPKELPIATIKVKDYGTITAELYPQYAPNTVNNFIALANSGFYDNLTFHRVVKDFVIQGGDPSGNGTGGPGYSIKGEFKGNGYKYNTLEHSEGVLSMARSRDMNSGGSQFFIVTKAAPSLDGSYAGFGKVIDGLDVVHKIENVEASNDMPNEEIVIEEIRVDTKGIDYSEPEKVK